MAADSESGYTLICEKSIRVKDASGAKQSDEDAAKERFSTLGERLKVIFKKGPSPVIKSGPGKVEIIDKSKLNNGNDNNNNPTNGDGNNPTNDSFNLRKKTYSIFEAYRKLNPQNKFYEDGAASPSLPFAGMDFPGMGDLINPGNNDDQEGQPDGEGDKESDDAEDDNAEKAKRQKMKENDTFVLGGSIGVRVLLENEGYTDWLLLIHQDAMSRLNDIKTKLINKNFEDAYNTATGKLKTDGLVPVGFKTYVYNNAKAHCPYIGYSNWALDIDDSAVNDNVSGTAADNANASYLSLAVAPYNRNSDTDKPKKAVYTAQYRVLNLGDFVKDSAFSDLFGKTLNAVKALADGDVSKIFQSGDSNNNDAPLAGGGMDTYNKFFSTRDKIDKALRQKGSASLEYQQDLSTPISGDDNSLAKSISSDNSFVTY